MKSPFLLYVFAALCATPLCSAKAAQGSGAPCPRYAPGSAVLEPKNLYSANGVLRVDLTYQTRLAEDGNRLFCLIDDAGDQSPTLHVRPGDEIDLVLSNNLPPNLPGPIATDTMVAAMPGLTVSSGVRPDCGNMAMTNASVNLHYHGTNLPPQCHADEVIKTLINPGESFEYHLRFPADEPPGLYWYHPHVHMISEPAVQGGATGAIIVEGIENVNPAVAGMQERTLLLRDFVIPNGPTPGGSVPSWNLSVNYVPVPYPTYPEALVAMEAGSRQLWRVVNAGADTLLDLQVQYDGVPQTIEIVALDGVPTGSQDGTARGKSLYRKDVVLAPAARAEFIVTAPAASVHSAKLVTLNVNTGPDGDSDPQRPLMTIATNTTVTGLNTLPEVPGPANRQRFAGLAAAKPVVQRKLFFSEVLLDPNNPSSPTNFYITVDGQTPVLFNPNNPPAIVTTQGSVEDWVVENRSEETHAFHIHQLHFLVLEQNGQEVSGQFLDTINVPFWSGVGPYPSVKLRMDFRGPDVGDFVYHCHILEHEDGGMMAIIRVLPAPAQAP